MKRNIATIVEHYLAAALWTSEIDDKSVKCDVSSKTINNAILHVQCFLGAALPILTDDWTDEQIGHDLWLTRSGHGTGFWDRDLPNTYRLTAICDKCKFNGEVFVDDDGIVHIEGDEVPLDLFKNYEFLPKEVQDIVLRDFDETYEDCKKLVNDLEDVGYTCEYYLDASPYHLRLNEKPIFEGFSEPPYMSP